MGTGSVQNLRFTIEGECPFDYSDSKPRPDEVIEMELKLICIKYGLHLSGGEVFEG